MLLRLISMMSHFPFLRRWPLNSIAFVEVQSCVIERDGALTISWPHFRDYRHGDAREQTNDNSENHTGKCAEQHSAECARSTAAY